VLSGPDFIGSVLYEQLHSEEVTSQICQLRTTDYHHVHGTQ